jgi:hypothetical protein
LGLSIAGTATRALDYVDAGFSTTIPAGQISATVDIVPLADALADPNETVIFSINASPATHVVGAPDTATVTIQ